MVKGISYKHVYKKEADGSLFVMFVCHGMISTDLQKSL